MSDSARWARINELFHAALATPAAERAAFLSDQCGSDAVLRAEVESLLAAHREGQTGVRSYAVAVGSRLGDYEVTGFIAAGGMGEVYRARDTRLGRDVAIKILPRLLSTEPERLARFEREARMLATLNHPHIGAIYGLEEADGVLALVLELVEGPTLADRLQRGPVPVTEAITITRQIADALDAAHEKGIIHRDLKPANIKVTPDGVVKVLDFGLAKAATGDGSTADLTQSPTVTVAGTREGIILGTAAYMSPEQARGQKVDKRTDIWAFGCVLFEMITGKPAFAGPTLSDVIATILEREPDWAALPAETPESVRHVLRWALAKDPRRRLRDIGDFRALVDDAGAAVHGTREQPSAIRTQTRWWVAGAAVALLAVSVAALYLRSPSSPVLPSRITRFTTNLDVPDFVSLDRQTVALSPDGSRIVYVARNDAGIRLYVRALGEFEDQPLVGTDSGLNPFFSPDGRMVGFFANGRLKKVSLAGGSPTDVCDVASVPLGATWSANGTIIFGSVNGSGLWQVPEGGGTPKLLKTVDGASLPGVEAWPHALPDGKSVVFTLIGDGRKPPRLAVVSLGSGERKTLIEGASPHYVSGGYLVYLQSQSMLTGVPFGLERLDVTGAPVPLVTRVQQAPNGGAAQFSLSENGDIVYVAPLTDRPVSHLTLVDQAGRAEPIAFPSRSYDNLRLSPDGQRIAVGVEDNGRLDVWLYDIPRATWSRLTFSGNNNVPIWTSDGKRVAFISDRDGKPKMYWKAADGTGSEELLSTEAGNPHSWSPDGRFVARTFNFGRASTEIGILSLDDRRTRPFLSTPEGNEIAAPAFSPDGRWLAYVSNETGRRQVYVRAFPTGEGRWLISSDGGIQPMWARSGRELFYRNAEKMMAVHVSADPVFRADSPRLLFEGQYQGPAVRADYDVTPDGRFVMIKADQQSSLNRELNVVVNWTEELKRLVPTQ